MLESGRAHPAARRRTRHTRRDRAGRAPQDGDDRPVTRLEALLSAVGILVLAVVVRTAAAAAVPFPVPEDTAYYWGVARNAVEGRGLVSDALWSFYLPPFTLPRPAFEIWLPLPSLLPAPLMAVIGNGFRVAQIPNALVSSIVPVLVWRLAADLADERRLTPLRSRVLAVGSGMVAAVYGPLVLYGALPDSTAPFTVAAVAACILMERVARAPRGARALDARLVGIGLALGIAALTRNEAIWYAFAWVAVAWGVAGSPGARDSGGRGRSRSFARLVGTPALLAIAAYAPWAVRQWATFGTPLPGQAVANAFSRVPSDIFAWADRPTLARWLAQGPAKLAADRVDGFAHNVWTVLVVPALPVGIMGLAGLPWILRSAVLRPLLIGAALTFLATTLLFPVSTAWGTFLHAAGPVHVLLLVSAMAGADAVVAWIGRRRAWRPGSAALAPLVVLALVVPMVLLTISSMSRGSLATERRYEELLRTTEAAGVALAANAPVISDHPVWLAESARVESLALPQESPADVLDLSRTFDARLLVISAEPSQGAWPAILGEGGPGSECFVPVPEATVRAPDGSDELLVYRIACP